MSKIEIKAKSSGDVSVKTGKGRVTSRASAHDLSVFSEAFVEAMPFAGMRDGRSLSSSLDGPISAALLVFLKVIEDREETATKVLRELPPARGALNTAHRVQASKALREAEAMKAFVADSFNRLHDLEEAAERGSHIEPAVIHLSSST